MKCSQLNSSTTNVASGSCDNGPTVGRRSARGASPSRKGGPIVGSTSPSRKGGPIVGSTPPKRKGGPLDQIDSAHAFASALDGTKPHTISSYLKLRAPQLGILNRKQRHVRPECAAVEAVGKKARADNAMPSTKLPPASESVGPTSRSEAASTNVAKLCRQHPAQRKNALTKS